MYQTIDVQSDQIDICTGYMIAKDWFLTAGHCFNNPKNPYSYFAFDRSIYGEDSFRLINNDIFAIFEPNRYSLLVDYKGVEQEPIIHKDFIDTINKAYDLALVKIKVPINYTEKLVSIAIGRSILNSQIQIMTNVSSVGWTKNKYTEIVNLERADLNIQQFTVKGSILTNSPDYNEAMRITVHANPINAVGVRSGDSGGPLVFIDQNLTMFSIGVLSSSNRVTEGKNSAHYTSITNTEIRDWIYQQTGLRDTEIMRDNNTFTFDTEKTYWENEALQQAVNTKKVKAYLLNGTNQSGDLPLTLNGKQLIVNGNGSDLTKFTKIRFEWDFGQYQLREEAIIQNQPPKLEIINDHKLRISFDKTMQISGKKSIVKIIKISSNPSLPEIVYQGDLEFTSFGSNDIAEIKFYTFNYFNVDDLMYPEVEIKEENSTIKLPSSNQLIPFNSILITKGRVCKTDNPYLASLFVEFVLPKAQNLEVPVTTNFYTYGVFSSYKPSNTEPMVLAVYNKSSIFMPFFGDRNKTEDLKLAVAISGTHPNLINKKGVIYFEAPMTNLYQTNFNCYQISRTDLTKEEYELQVYASGQFNELGEWESTQTIDVRFAPDYSTSIWPNTFVSSKKGRVSLGKNIDYKVSAQLRFPLNNKNWLTNYLKIHDEKNTIRFKADPLAQILTDEDGDILFGNIYAQKCLRS